MAKPDLGGPAPWRERVRRSFGEALAHDVRLLGIHEHSLKMIIDGDQVQALTHDEQQHVRQARVNIHKERVRLNALAQRIQSEN